MKVKCVIFDMDGLMFDTERIGSFFLKAAAKEYGYIVSDELRFKLLGRNRKANRQTMMEHFGKDYPYDDISKLSQQHKKEYLKKYGLPVKKGLVTLLDYLKEQEILIAVASSSNYEVIQEYLTMSKVINKIDYVIAGNQVTNSKPDPEIFLKVVEYFNLEPSDVLVLEDSKYGILAATKGNIPVICIPDLVKHDQSITDLTVATLNDLSEVIAYLK